ncbi:hypothetical protein SRHO_G00276380 [Serrasalmus rhombeus]
MVFDSSRRGNHRWVAYASHSCPNRKLSARSFVHVTKKNNLMFGRSVDFGKKRKKKRRLQHGQDCISTAAGHHLSPQFGLHRWWWAEEG